MMRESKRFEGITNWRFHCNDEAEDPLRRGQKRNRSKAMDRMLVVAFDTEPKAYEGKKALQQSESEGTIVVYSDAVGLD
jgi:hypothetical protein